MDFRELSYVISIAKHQGVGKASRELNVSQSTLSKFVQKLENDLGFTLFNKLGNKFLLTYAGERYIDTAKVILNLKRDLDNELSVIQKEYIGELKIGLPIMRSQCILPNVLPVFRDKFPNIKINTYEANSKLMEQMILNGDLDLAFVIMPAHNINLSCEVLLQEEIVLIMSQDHPKAGHACRKEGLKYPWIDIVKLSSEQFILQWPDQRSRQIVEKIFHEEGIHPQKILTIRNIITSIQLAANGYGIAFTGELPLHYLRLDKNISCFSVGHTLTTFDLSAIYRNGVNLPLPIREFIDIVREQLHQRTYHLKPSFSLNDGQCNPVE